MIETESRLFQLIALELNGENLSEEDKLFLASWRQSHPQHEALYLHYKSLWQHKKTLSTWDLIIKKTPHSYRKIRRRLIRQKMIYWSRFAAVIIPFLFGVFFLLRPISKTNSIIQVDETIIDTLSKAYLVLETGVKIALTDQGTLPDKNANIDVIQNNILKYHSSSAKTIEKTVYHTIKVNRGSDFKLSLADGTNIWLNSDSELRYPNQFTDSTRQVFLKGEAYFDVTLNQDKPFLVTTTNGIIRVLGTEFNVTAYNDEEQTTTTLVHGSVIYNYGEKQLRLLPGEQCVHSSKNQQATVQKVNVNQYMSWRDGKFLFEETSLHELAKQISRWYDVEVEFTDQYLEKYKFTGAMERNRPITFLVDLLNATNTLSCQLRDHKMILSPKKH